mmetsp:Transcript_28004/g.69930  ORF Transcript_28004/g.69930 Transcript_28004/m.69930 type:complete len:519 (+) Transcript_28004:1557-3113(+)
MHNGGEVVVGQHHVARLLRNLSPSDAHSDPDVGLLERGGVVDTVARHGSDLTEFSQNLNDKLFVLRLSAAEHGALSSCEDLDSLLLCEHLELAAREGTHRCRRQAVLSGAFLLGRLRGENADLLADGLGRQLVVSCDHNDFDAGLVALGDGACHLRARGVHDAHQTHIRHPLFDLDKVAGLGEQVVRTVGGAVVVPELSTIEPDGHGEGTQRFTCHVIDFARNGVSHCVGEAGECAVGQHQGVAPVQNALRRTLAEQKVGLGTPLLCEHTHGFAVSREFQSGHLLQRRDVVIVEDHGSVPVSGLEVSAGQRCVGAAELLNQHPQCGFGGLPGASVSAGVPLDLQCAVVAHRAHLGEPLKAPVRRTDRRERLGRSIVDGDLAHWRVGRPAHHIAIQRISCFWEAEADAAHLVGRQGACLVRADDSGAAECLHRRQPTDYRIPLGHFACAECEACGDDRRQSLRDGSHGECDGDFEVVDAATQEAAMRGIAEISEVDEPDDHTDDANHLGEQLPELIQLL